MRKNRMLCSAMLGTMLFANVVFAGEAEVDAGDAGTLSFAVNEGEDPAQGFVCLVAEDGNVYWQTALNSFDEVFDTFGLTDDGSFLKVSTAPDNGKDFPLLYPEEAWKGLIFAEAVPEWFDEDAQANVTVAFESWKEEVYGLFDYEAIRTLSIEDTIAVSPADDYELSEEDMEALKGYVNKEDALYVYSRDSVIDTINKYCGTAIGNTMQGMFVKASMQLKSTVASDELASELGVMPRGVTAINFMLDVVGSYFDIDEDSWVDCNLDVEGYPYAPARYLFDRGLYPWRDDGTNDWFLSATSGTILLRAKDSEIGPAQAFACLVDEEGNVYWQAGLDGSGALENEYADSITSEYVCAHVKPVLDEAEATIEIPDGLDPSIMHNYVYFDPASVWTFSIEGEKPEWFTDEYEENVMNAYNEWFEALNNGIDFDGIIGIWGGQPETIEMSDEDYEYLRQWASAWQTFTDAGLNPASSIKEKANAVYGMSVWADLIEYNTADWRVHHTVCTGAAIQEGYEAYTGITEEDPDYFNLTSVVPGSVLDMQTALIASYMDIDWGEELGENPYECVAKLVADGLVPNTDGVKWYLTNTDTAEVVCEIAKEELLAE